MTGARDALPTELPDQVARVRRVTKLPIGVGFGVQTPEQAGWVAGFADAVIVGSAVSKRIEEAEPTAAPDVVGEFVRSLATRVRAESR